MESLIFCHTGGSPPLKLSYWNLAANVTNPLQVRVSLALGHVPLCTSRFVLPLPGIRSLSVPTVDLDVGGFLFPLAVSLQRLLFHSATVFHTPSLTRWTTVGHGCSIFSRSVREHKHVWKVRFAHLKNVALEHRVASPAVTLSADFFTGRSPVVTIPTDTLPSET